MDALVELTNGWVLPVLLAPFVGSFLGVLIRRLPRDQPALWGRSACEACGHRLTPRELIPILSFAAQRGRCAACAAPIAPAHLAVELSALALAAICAALLPASAPLWAGCVLAWALLTLAWIDAEHFFLPDALTLPLLLAGLAEAWTVTPEDLPDRALAAALAYAALRALAATYRALRGREGLGQGDAKLLAASGAWLGTAALPDVLLLAATLALAALLVARLRGAALTATTRLPFGPFLAVATLALFLVGWA